MIRIFTFVLFKLFFPESKTIFLIKIILVVFIFIFSLSFIEEKNGN
jgi:hypothetical protein